MAIKRLIKEMKSLQENPYSEFSIHPKPDKFLDWEGIIFGPESSPYQGGIFKFEMKFPKEYPNKPPKLQFITPLFHPNIYTNGKVCIVFTGVTTTTCVKKTVLSTRNQFPGVKVVVPFDSVGARLKYYKGKNDPEADYDAAETISPYIGNYDSKVAEIADKMWTQGITVTTLDQLIKEFNSQ